MKRLPANAYPHIAVADKHVKRMMLVWLSLLERLKNDFKVRQASAHAQTSSPSFVAALTAPSLPITKADGELTSLLASIATEAGQTLGFQGSFSNINAEAVKWAQQHSGELINGIDNQTQRLVANLISRVHESELTVDSVARDIKQLIGLTPGQAQAALNYRDSLITRQLTERYGRDSANALTNVYTLNPWRGGPLDKARIATLFSQYVDRQLKYRAENIARTETVIAATEGRILAWNDHIGNGGADGYIVRQEWSVTNDDRACEECLALDGEVLESSEVSPNNRPSLDSAGTFPGGYDGPPAHSSCRCVVIVTLEEPQTIHRLFA